MIYFLMSTTITFAALFVSVLLAASAVDENNLEVYRSLTGGSVNLPCDISSPLPKDRMRVVLWYKGDSEVPLYSLDSRSKENPHHSKSESIGRRAYFVLSAKIPFLKLQNLSQSDEDLYKCRVDFMKSRTVSHWMKLQIIVPPDPPIIVDSNGQILHDQIGPYNEGDPLFLTCLSRTGKPQPSLIWWMSSKVIDGEYKRNRKGDMSNELVISKLSRKDLHKELVCQASNNNATPPATKTVILDLNLKPLEVKIVSQKKYMSAGQKVKLLCQATGSRPPAVITWWKGSKKMKRAESSSSLNTNLVTSILKFVPSFQDNGKYLSCRAENLHIPSSAKESGWKLNVHFKPIPSLHFGSKVSDNRIFEGTDVFLACNIQANPWFTEVQWYHNGVELFHNPNEGIIISTQSLALEKVTKDRRGNYTCKASNKEGSGYSNSVYLRVQYAPVCKRNMKSQYKVSKNKATSVKCEVDADPEQVSFQWSFVRKTEKRTLDAFSNNRTTSIISYITKTDEDYGMLICSARNSIGSKSAHCTFHVTFAEPPGPVSDCTVMNTSSHLLHVICSPGYDGGLPQTFHMEVYDQKTRAKKANITVKENPIFIVSDLPPNLSYTLVIYAANEVGRSHMTSMTAQTSKKKVTQDMNFKEASGKAFAIRPLLGVLIGIVATLVLIAISFVPMRLRKSNTQQRGPDNDIEEKTYTTVQQDNPTCHTSGEKKSPDIVPACIRVTDCGQSNPRPIEDHSYTPFYTEELYETASSNPQDRPRKMKRISWQTEQFEQSLL